MRQKDRLKEIKQQLLARQEIDVEEACDIFKVSPATIRRDFQLLENDTDVVRTWGGIAIKPRQDDSAPGYLEFTPSNYRKSVFAEQKLKIAEKAASYVKDGDIIMVDGGTTTYYMSKFLAPKNIKVITNSVLIANSIDMDRQSKFGGAEVFITGGLVYPTSGLLVGPQAVMNIKQYHANLAFLSVGGIETDLATNSNQLIVETERAIIEQSEKVIMLADSSKFGKRSLCRLCDVDEIDLIITDKKEEAESIVNSIRKKGVAVEEV